MCISMYISAPLCTQQWYKMNVDLLHRQNIQVRVFKCEVKMQDLYRVFPADTEQTRDIWNCYGILLNKL